MLTGKLLENAEPDENPWLTAVPPSQKPVRGHKLTGSFASFSSLNRPFSNSLSNSGVISFTNVSELFSQRSITYTPNWVGSASSPLTEDRKSTRLNSSH